MSSRESILTKIQALKHKPLPLPAVTDYDFKGDLKTQFIRSIEGNKGEVIIENKLNEFIEINQYTKVIALAKGFGRFNTEAMPTDPHRLANIEVAILDGQFGVAENGAIWLTDENLGLRALPFITEHLVIVLKEDQLVGNMHQAYQKIGNQQSGFGLFIAGPSKTADIEQSLVIGAHGAKSLMVLVRSEY